MTASKRKPYHPPAAAEYALPESEYPGYILSPLGVQGFGGRRFFTAQIPSRLAREIIIRNHYSGRVVNNSYLHMGVVLDGGLKGVLQFGYALNPHRAGKVVRGTEVGQYLELNRMWMCDSAPRNTESRAISHCVKYIRRAMPTVAWIQSFADERCGGLGVVYQAANFLYCGCHLTTFWRLDGEYYHDMLLTAHKKGGLRGRFLRENIGRAEKFRFRQFRYVYFLKRPWRARLNFDALPYPKPARPADTES
jgi:hypothetical protein